MYKRIVLKMSGEAMFGNGQEYDKAAIAKIIDEVKEIIRLGTQVAIVTGGGNYWRGRKSDPDINRVKSDHIGMLATVMNALYLSECFRLQGIDATVMTPFNLCAFAESFSKEKAEVCLKARGVVIFAGGTGHPYFSTDTIVSLRGAEIEADALLFAKSATDGVYDKDPNKPCGKGEDAAIKLEQISFDDIIKNNLDVIDIAAALICKEHSMKAVIFEYKGGNFLKAAKGEAVGTMVH